MKEKKNSFYLLKSQRSSQNKRKGKEEQKKKNVHTSALRFILFSFFCLFVCFSLYYYFEVI